MASHTVFLVFFAFAALPAQALELQTAANPIRRVVSMLQSMQQSVIKEGEKEKELYEKFMCYCKSSVTDLGDSIAKAEDKLSTLPSEIEEAEDKLKATKESLKKAQADRTSAKAAMGEATGIREKEAKAYMTTKGEYDANIGAIKKAVAALSAGMKGGFLQTNAAQILRKLVADKQDMQDEDREELSSFLSVNGGSAYAPQSGAITGILKQMGDEMSKALAEATSLEEGAIKDFDGMIAAKTKEVAALTKSIEKKTKETGDMGVALVQMKDDLDDTEKSSVDDKKFLKDLEAGCSTKTAEWDKICQTRQEELSALADTVKILNDDDALELFKKTLPAPSASFVQVRVSAAALRARALVAVRKAAGATRQNRVEIDLISLALQGKKVDFTKVTAMIDNMVALLKTEQTDDDEKKAYCEEEFDTSDDKKKALEKSFKDADAAVAVAKKGIETTTGEIAALAAAIKRTDAEVSESTEQRQAENSEFKELTAADTATKELLLFAKNRLNKFYSPKLYKSAPKEELSSEGRIDASFKFAQVNVHGAPPPPPAAPGPYKKKGEESSGVIAMIDLLVADMDKEMTEAKAEEKDAQLAYEQFISDSAEKRSADKKSLEDKEGVKADMEAELEAQTSVAKDTTAELYATMKYIDSLHKECDFLLSYYDVRKQARTTEVQSLADAKAVLSGADFSL